MAYLADIFEADSKLELTPGAKQFLDRIELPTEAEWKVVGRATLLAYLEGVDAIHTRHVNRAWRDWHKLELDAMEEKGENHNEISRTQNF
jgi:formylglycine-generating enzyme required for sulfatase activity